MKKNNLIAQSKERIKFHENTLRFVWDKWIKPMNIFEQGKYDEATTPNINSKSKSSVKSNIISMKLYVCDMPILESSCKRCIARWMNIGEI